MVIRCVFGPRGGGGGGESSNLLVVRSERESEERETETGRQTDRQADRQTEKERKKKGRGGVGGNLNTIPEKDNNNKEKPTREYNYEERKMKINTNSTFSDFSRSDSPLKYPEWVG